MTSAFLRKKVTVDGDGGLGEQKCDRFSSFFIFHSGNRLPP
ncbi:MAG TPA: hypothetical protein V6D26_24220 [Stenomitos sp.]